MSANDDAREALENARDYVAHVSWPHKQRQTEAMNALDLLDRALTEQDAALARQLEHAAVIMEAVQVLAERQVNTLARLNETTHALADLPRAWDVAQHMKNAMSEATRRRAALSQDDTTEGGE